MEKEKQMSKDKNIKELLIIPPRRNSYRNILGKMFFMNT